MTPVEVVKMAGELHDKSHEFSETLKNLVHVMAEHATAHPDDPQPDWFEFFMMFLVQAKNTVENCCDITKAIALSGVRDERAKNAENN